MLTQHWRGTFYSAASTFNWYYLHTCTCSGVFSQCDDSKNMSISSTAVQTLSKVSQQECLYFTYLQTKTPRYLHSHLANSSNFNCEQPDLFTFWCLSGVRGPADTEDWLQVDVPGYSTWWQVCKVLHLYPPCQLTTTDLCRCSHLKKFPHCNLCGNQHWRCLKKVYTFVAKTRN